MKNLMKSMWILAASALAFSSCIEEQNIVSQDDMAKKVTVDITAVGEETKTHYDNTLQIKWDNTESLTVIENKANNAVQATGTSADGLTAKFTAQFKEDLTSNSFDYWGIYASNYIENDNANLSRFKFEIPAVQTSSATSFDPKADILISQKVTTATQATDLNFNFKRPIGVAEMNLKGMTSGENLTSVIISSKEDIVGRFYFDLNSGKVTNPAEDYGYDHKKEITVNVNLTTAAETKIYFTVLPVAVTELTILATTDKATYSRTIDLTQKNFSFKPNTLTKFGVPGLVRDELKSDKYTLLTDASVLGEGDKILIVANDETAGTVAMADQAKDYRNDVAVTINSDNTITSLPNGIQVIELINSTVAGEFHLRTSNDPVLELEHHGKNNLYSSEIGDSWKITVANGKTEFSTSDDNGRRYIRYNYNGGTNSRFSCYTSGQTDVQIFFKKGTPRTALPTPTNLYAEQEDVKVNSVTVIWDAVLNASSYTVTCGDKVQTVNTTSATIADLAWATSYTISVVANPEAGSETLKSSAAATTNVTTGRNPNEVILLEEGDYVVMYATGTSYKGLTSTASRFNLQAADVTYDGQAKNVTVTKDLIWHIKYNSQQAAYSFFNAATGKYLTMQSGGGHDNAKLGTEAFHDLASVEGVQNTFTIGANKKLFYKGAYTEFTFDGTAPAGTDHLLIIPAVEDITPVYSLGASTAEIASAAATAATLTTVTANEFITESKFSVSSNQTWLTNLKVAGGKVVADVAANTASTSRAATVTVTYTGAKVATQTINVTQLAAGTVTVKNIALNEVSGTLYTEKVKVNNIEYTAYRFGKSKSSTQGVMSIAANDVLGNGTLEFDAARWNGDSGKMTIEITIDGVLTKHSITLKTSAGLSGSSPYIITDYDAKAMHFSLPLEGITTKSKIEIKNDTGSKKRLAVWNVTYKPKN